MLCFAALLLAGCHRGGGLPQGVMDEGKMVDFLTDAYLLEGFYAIETQFRYDAVSPEVLHRYDSILTVHGITRDEVERSLAYYSQQLLLYEAIHDSVVVRLEEQRAALPPDTSKPVVMFSNGRRPGR